MTMKILLIVSMILSVVNIAALIFSRVEMEKQSKKWEKDYEDFRRMIDKL